MGQSPTNPPKDRKLLKIIRVQNNRLIPFMHGRKRHEINHVILRSEGPKNLDGLDGLRFFASLPGPPNPAIAGRAE